MFVTEVTLKKGGRKFWGWVGCREVNYQGHHQLEGIEEEKGRRTYPSKPPHAIHPYYENFQSCMSDLI